MFSTLLYYPLKNVFSCYFQFVVMNYIVMTSKTFLPFLFSSFSSLRFHSITKSHNVVVFISIPLTFLPNPGQRVTGRILIVPSPSVRSCGISTLFEALVLLSPRSRCIDVYERTSQEHIQTKELALMDDRFTQR